MKLTIRISISVLLMCIANSLFAQENGLEVGDKVDSFSATADNGKSWNSEKILGKKNLVVYFYPAAMTGGCTKQACAYRDSKDELSSAEAMVVGVSGDEVEGLELFKRVHGLNFPLLADPDGKIARQFGVPIKDGIKSIEREIEGELRTLTRGLTTSRWTFVINKLGELVYKSTEVNAAEDAKSVLEVLSGLN